MHMHSMRMHIAYACTSCACIPHAHTHAYHEAIEVVEGDAEGGATRVHGREHAAEYAGHLGCECESVRVRVRV